MQRYMGTEFDCQQWDFNFFNGICLHVTVNSSVVLKIGGKKVLHLFNCEET